MDEDITEYSLDELVDDPLIGLLMKSDGVDRRSIEVLFERVARERLRGLHGFRPHLEDKEIERCITC